MREPTAPATNTRCHRCGGLLGMGRTVLYTRRPGDAGRLRTYSTRAVNEIRLRWPGDVDSTFCQRCRQRSLGVPPAPSSSFGRRPTITRVLAHFVGGLTAAKKFLRPHSTSEDAERHVDLVHLLAGFNFPVHGFRGGPGGLRLRDVGWIGRGSGGSRGQVRLRYAAGGPNGPRRAVELSQDGTIVGEAAVDRPFSELQAIVGLVTSHGSEELRREYRLKGNVHRDWNLDRISRTKRRRLTVTIGGGPMKVELAYWWKPEQVVVAHMTPDGHSILATSLGISHIELLTLLKTMVVLQRDSEALGDHQQQYEEQAHRERI